MDQPVGVITLRQRLRNRARIRVSERKRREKLAVIRFAEVEQPKPVANKPVANRLKRAKAALDVANKVANKPKPKRDRKAYQAILMRRRRAAAKQSPPA